MDKIPVFYSSKMVAVIDSVSPSARKPGLVVDAWASRFPIDMRDVPALTEDDFLLAHDLKYVRDVLTLKAPNGFGNKSAEVAASLPFTNGSMVAATLEAVENGALAVSPSSGFHHAGYYDGGGFCTFNGLIIAARKAIQMGAAKKVGILDCDQHYGDGTEDIIKQRKLSNVICNVTVQKNYQRDAEPFLKSLQTLVESFDDFDVLIYQAGADPHINDPLGGYLSTEQMRERDRIVFTTARRMGLPVAWNLAGGYQTPVDAVVELHVNTMAECVAVYCGQKQPHVLKLAP